MKVEKITDTFVNEFDVQAQKCWNDCTEYFGRTKENIDAQYPEIREHYGWDAADCQNVISEGKTYCYRDHTPKTNIYW